MAYNLDKIYIDTLKSKVAELMFDLNHPGTDPTHIKGIKKQLLKTKRELVEAEKAFKLFKDDQKAKEADRKKILKEKRVRKIKSSDIKAAREKIKTLNEDDLQKRKDVLEGVDISSLTEGQKEELNVITHKTSVKETGETTEKLEEEKAVFQLVERMENSKVLTFMRNPLKTIGGAIGSGIMNSKALGWLGDKKDAIVNSPFGKAMGAINTKMGIGIKAISTFFQGSFLGKIVSGLTKPLFGKLGGFFKKMFPYSNIVDFLMSPAGIGMIMAIWILFRNFIWNPILKPIWMWIQDAIAFVIDLPNWIEKKWNQWSLFINDMYEKAIDWTTEHIMTPILNIWDKYVKPIIDKIWNAVRLIYSKVLKILSGIFNGIATVLDKLANVTLLGKQPFGFLSIPASAYYGLADGISKVAEFMYPGESTKIPKSTSGTPTPEKDTSGTSETPTTEKNLIADSVTSGIPETLTTEKNLIDDSVTNDTSETITIEKNLIADSVTSGLKHAMINTENTKEISIKKIHDTIKESDKQDKQKINEQNQKIDEVLNAVNYSTEQTNSVVNNNRISQVQVNVPDKQMNETISNPMDLSISSGALAY